MFLVGSRLVQRFINLLDTFASYTGKGGYILRVKTTEDGVEGISIIDAAGMVSGAALTLLANIPALAGLIPLANIPTILYTKGGTGLTALGTALQVLRMNAGATAIEFGTLLFGDMFYADTRFAVGSFTRDISTASGTQAITGTGFAPKSAIFFAIINTIADEYSWGVDNAAGHKVIMGWYSPSNSLTESDSASIYITISAGSAAYYGSVTSWDTNGFTISWTRGGTPTGTMTIKYIAFR